MPDRSMNILRKGFDYLLNTKGLIDSINETESALEKTLRGVGLPLQGRDHLPGRSDDCQAVKKRLNELAMQVPKNSEGKKMTEETKAWLKSKGLKIKND